MPWLELRLRLLLREYPAASTCTGCLTNASAGLPFLISSRHLMSVCCFVLCFFSPFGRCFYNARVARPKRSILIRLLPPYTLILTSLIRSLFGPSYPLISVLCHTLFSFATHILYKLFLDVLYFTYTLF